MKKVLLMAAASLALVLGGCGNNGSNSNNPALSTTAIVPNACGQGVPAGYCTSYNPTAYPVSPYENAGYNPYGIPSYTYGTYGCPAGFQPIYNGGTYTCVSANYISSAYSYGGYSGYGLYYPSSYSWPGGLTGYGPGIACTPYSNTCQGNSLCITPSGAASGYCSVKNGF